jgi:hypothetical protein
VCAVRSGRAILVTSAAAGIAIGIEHHLARQIWLGYEQGGGDVAMNHPPLRPTKHSNSNTPPTSE